MAIAQTTGLSRRSFLRAAAGGIVCAGLVGVSSSAPEAEAMTASIAASPFFPSDFGSVADPIIEHAIDLGHL